jgi:ubiquinone/menaquinone biosynthesis C-methylase UbiE
MNLLHNRICASAKWADYVRTGLFPAVLDGVDLGDDLLEVGPGLGVTTHALAERVARLTALEVEEEYVTRLRREFDRPDVEIVHGDAAAMPFPDAAFSGVACFTMLHHVPTPELQDRVFAEACRVLRPGGVFAGSDGRVNLRFRLIHLGDTLVPVDPATLPARLEAAGFTDVKVTPAARRVHFTARRPA